MSLLKDVSDKLITTINNGSMRHISIILASLFILTLLTLPAFANPGNGRITSWIIGAGPWTVLLRIDDPDGVSSATVTTAGGVANTQGWNCTTPFTGAFGPYVAADFPLAITYTDCQNVVAYENWIVYANLTADTTNATRLSYGYVGYGKASGNSMSTIGIIVLASLLIFLSVLVIKGRNQRKK